MVWWQNKCFKVWGFIWDHFQIDLLEVLEVLLDLLRPLHTVLGLQVDLGLLKMVTNDSPYPKTLVFVARTMSLACSEAELDFHFLKYFLTSYSPSTQFLAFRSIWGFLKWSQMIPHIPKHWFCHQNHVYKHAQKLG